MSFLNDLAVGEANQHKVVEILNTYFPEGKWEVNTEKTGVDIVSHTGITVECKYDRRVEETGNIFIEVSCSDKPSGIYKYEGINVLSYSYSSTTLLINVNVLKDFINTNSTRLKKIKCGDGWRSVGYLISLHEAKQLPLTKIIEYGN